MALHSSMAKALRLTRAGNLMEATALIRATLAGAGSPDVVDAPSSRVIDLVPVRVDPPAAAKGSFESHRHLGAAGSIGYLLYTPGSAVPGMPLVIMLHGCTQSPEDFARGTAMNAVADEKGFLVAYPRQTRAANAQRCWNWFRPADQDRGRGEPALLAGLISDIVETAGVDPTRVYVAGLSAGGAAAAVLADTYPDLIAAVGIHSGIGCGVARDLPSALAAMKRGGKRNGQRPHAERRFVPVITFHGDRDAIVREVNARDIVDAATTAAGVATRVEMETGEANGRRYTRALSLDDAGRVRIEQWTIVGAGHAWSGGDPAGSYTDASGPDASRAMAEFFLSWRRAN